MDTGTVFNIQKFCTNDGPGIRTTVFVKGCPLHCMWCHNPESLSSKPELLYNSEKCVSCGKCAVVCPKCHSFTEDGTHIFDRSKCIACGKCAESCYHDALELCGQEKNADEIIAEVLKDEAFYENSNGGMTISGGEPMACFDFTKALLKSAKEKNLHICMETSGFGKTEHFKEIAQFVDIFLFDYKLTNPDEHKKYTGVSNDIILNNLHVLDSIGAKTVLRCPIIPTINDNDEHFSGIAETANSLKNIIEINVEPYHPMGSGKRESLGKANELKHLTFPEPETVEEWMKAIQPKTGVPVKKA